MKTHHLYGSPAEQIKRVQQIRNLIPLSPIEDDSVPISTSKVQDLSIRVGSWGVVVVGDHSPPVVGLGWDMEGTCWDMEFCILRFAFRWFVLWCISQFVLRMELF